MSETTTNAAPLTVALIHGAFADASSWNGVIERLQASGFQVTAPAIPLRGIACDSAYIASFLRQIPGPVLAVGHSYGGAVISNAAADAGNVVGLVFVAAFATDEGERLGEVESTSKDSVLMPALVPLQYPTGDGAATATEFAIDPAGADVTRSMAKRAGATITEADGSHVIMVSQPAAVAEVILAAAAAVHHPTADAPG
jgi:pimeloyl-ACP methyl ester carboxylesterase